MGYIKIINYNLNFRLNLVAHVGLIIHFFKKTRKHYECKVKGMDDRGKLSTYMLVFLIFQYDTLS